MWRVLIMQVQVTVFVLLLTIVAVAIFHINSKRCAVQYQWMHRVLYWWFNTTTEREKILENWIICSIGTNKVRKMRNKDTSFTIVGSRTCLVLAKVFVVYDTMLRTQQTSYSTSTRTSVDNPSFLNDINNLMGDRSLWCLRSISVGLRSTQVYGRWEIMM